MSDSSFPFTTHLSIQAWLSCHLDSSVLILFTLPSHPFDLLRLVQKEVIRDGIPLLSSVHVFLLHCLSLLCEACRDGEGRHTERLLSLSYDGYFLSTCLLLLTAMRFDLHCIGCGMRERTDGGKELHHKKLEKTKQSTTQARKAFWCILSHLVQLQARSK